MTHGQNFKRIPLVTFSCLLIGCFQTDNTGSAYAYHTHTVSDSTTTVITPYEQDSTPFKPDKKLSEGFEFDIINVINSPLPTDTILFSNKMDVASENIFGFRGNSHRNNPTRGAINFQPSAIKNNWVFTTGYDTTTTRYGRWGGGSGWTGQPCAVKWTREQKHQLGIIDPSFLDDENAIELIIGSLCGDIYFLNASTGQPTRKSLTINNPIKGTVSVDPRKNGLLYVGQGIPNTPRFGAYVFDMFTGKEVFHISGNDPDSRRNWGAFDSNPLIDEKTGNVFWPAENGLIYNFVLDENKQLSKLRKLRYNHPKLFRYGIESSMSAIDNFGFFSDNGSTLMCIDLNSLEPVWNVDNFDDSDASVMIDKEDDHYFLYTGHEIDKLGPKNDAHFRKISAKNGSEAWRISRTCFNQPINGKPNDGGILATPVLGKHKGEHLVFCIFSRIDNDNRGEIVAINKYSGEEEWNLVMEGYSWSSPADFYDNDGNLYLFVTDVRGNIYLLDGITGEVKYHEKTKYTFESSPIILEDRVYIASRGKSILCFQLQ